MVKLYSEDFRDNLHVAENVRKHIKLAIYLWVFIHTLSFLDAIGKPDNALSTSLHAHPSTLIWNFVNVSI